MSVIAVIPARGGSKRIPRKNIKPFLGVPLLQRAVNCALESDVFSRVVVSTDDVEIQRLSMSWGAEAPSLRPARLSDDYAGTSEVIAHVVSELDCHEADEICAIYATTPLMRSADLVQSLDRFRVEDCSFCFAVTSFEFPVQRAMHVRNGKCFPMYPAYERSRSQDLVEAFHDAGCFYWGSAKDWREQRSLYDGHAIPFFLPRYRVQDIDTEEDWERAELMFRVLNNDECPNKG